MGFFSSIGNAISGAFSAIGSAISSVCSAIGGALFTGGGGIAEIATSLLGIGGILSPELTLGLMVVIAVVSAIAEVLGVKEEEEKPEELGMKAEAAEKKPEDFDSTKEYIEYLRNEVEIDKEKLENLSEEEKAKYATIGASLYVKQIQEEYNIELPAESIGLMTELSNNNKLTKEEIGAIVKASVDSGITDFKEVTDYIEGKPNVDGTEPSVISGTVMDALKATNPDLSDDEIAERFISLSNDD